MTEDWDQSSMTYKDRQKFLGEDDDDVKDNWDDEDEEEAPVENEPPVEPIKEKKKSLSVKIAEKEEIKKKEKQEKEKKRLQEEASKTPEQILEEKRREQRLQEESDLMLAKETFGITEKNLLGGDLVTKEDFDVFRRNLLLKLETAHKSTHYITFLEQMFREICVNIDPDDIKKLLSSLNALYNEKLRATKASKPKKKGIKGKIKMERNVMEYNDEFDDEYDDEFI